ncbi:Fur family transcriptional regulator [Lentilactobacillus farraginis]|uniref:Fur family transcriptional regulator n=1 Tax=Lentilactobacillus farraginis DSM 18382 = JCM 14108 TaxID=1423743 RepID=X0P9P2_9LACO|nr:Fur family transcriptional regulator [Lentilactobacillus farraginis]KRM11092.1 Fur family transcriptional regulator [Lentilactobacillus farraginis DSM 18382 = JCM 14108]GAF35628.1 peroxide stress regulator PerR, FUR family [Lentilactobacillus farraginis DSM 18382 = JCM 14108]
MATNTQLDVSLKRLKKKGIRITPQREIILTYLISHHNHPSVETIRDGIDEKLPNLSVATIYNTLKLFVDNGLAIELPNKDGGLRYDFFGVPHYHAICENCGKIFDIFDESYPEIVAHVKQVAQERVGFKVTGAQLEVTGICPKCEKKLAAKKTVAK